MDDAFANATITTTIAEATEEPTEPETPEDPDEPTDPETPEDPSDNNGGEYVDENGNPITKLPQTGSVVPAIIAGVAILVVASLVVFKATRK